MLMMMVCEQKLVTDGDERLTLREEGYNGGWRKLFISLHA